MQLFKGVSTLKLKLIT